MKENDFHKVPEHDFRCGTYGAGVVKIGGIVTTGVEEARFLTELPWVRKQFVDKLRIIAYPGTLNILVPDEDRENLSTVRKAKGVEIIPTDTSFCIAKSFPALVGGKIRGAVIIPLVPNYPRLQLEIISSQNIRQSLSLRDGDLVEVEVHL